MSFNPEEYEPVEDRIRAFWSDHPKGRILTDLVRYEAGEVVVKAEVWREASAPNEYPLNSDFPDASGYAQEREGSGFVNKTSWLENCETSAIGRALANLGYAAKGKRPSREEMTKASAAGTAAEPGSAGRNPSEYSPADVPDPGTRSDAPASVQAGEGDKPGQERSGEGAQPPGPSSANIWAELKLRAKSSSVARMWVNDYFKTEYSAATVQRLDPEYLQEVLDAHKDEAA